MTHPPQTRGRILGQVLGITLFVTGLQKKVLSPVLNWFSELDVAIQLSALGTIVAVAAIIAGLVWRRGRRSLRAASAVVEASRPIAVLA